MPVKSSSLASLAIAIAIPLLVGASSAALSGPGMKAAYAASRQAPWAPPAWLFGPVWTVLYALMGVAAWRVWTAAGGAWTPALTWFAAQLALNAAWSPVYFRLRKPGLALGILAALLAVLVQTTRLFWKADAPAGKLLVPYVLWGAYASTLNAYTALKR